MKRYLIALFLISSTVLMAASPSYMGELIIGGGLTDPDGGGVITKTGDISITGTFSAGTVSFDNAIVNTDMKFSQYSEGEDVWTVEALHSGLTFTHEGEGECVTILNSGLVNATLSPDTVGASQIREGESYTVEGLTTKSLTLTGTLGSTVLSTDGTKLNVPDTITAEDILPVTDYHYYLGSNSKRWNGLYVVTLNVAGASYFTSTADFAGTIKAGSEDHVLTNPQGYIIGPMETGAISEGELADDSVTQSKIAVDSVGASELREGESYTVQNLTVLGTLSAATTESSVGMSVEEGEISADAVTSAKIKDLTIVAGDISANTITGAKIANETITGTQILDGTIAEGELGSNSVTSAKIAANTIVAADIAAGTITGTQISDGTIAEGELGTGSVTSAKILNSTIVSGDIAAGTITGANILDGTIAEGELGSNSVTSAKIAANTIVAADISAGTITGTQIADGTIAEGELGTGSVTSTKILDDTITASDLAADSVGASEIAEGETYQMAGLKIIGTPYSAGMAQVKKTTVQSGTAPTTLLTANYLQIGGMEWTTDSLRAIGFGYVHDQSTYYAPAYIAYQEKANTLYTKGDLVFYTRNVETNTAPSERLRINAAGNTVAAGTLTGLTSLTLNGTTGSTLLSTASDGSLLTVSDPVTVQGALVATTSIDLKGSSTGLSQIRTASNGLLLTLDDDTLVNGTLAAGNTTITGDISATTFNGGALPSPAGVCEIHLTNSTPTTQTLTDSGVWYAMNAFVSGNTTTVGTAATATVGADDYITINTTGTYKVFGKATAKLDSSTTITMGVSINGASPTGKLFTPSGYWASTVYAEYTIDVVVSLTATNVLRLCVNPASAGKVASYQVQTLRVERI